MKTVTNLKMVKRNAKIGQYTSLGALVVLGIGLYLTFKMPDKFAFSLGRIANWVLYVPGRYSIHQSLGAQSSSR